MVTIKKIEIKDYFGRGNFEWNLDPVVNILGGKNGSGKSSLFRLCYLMMSSGMINESLDKRFSAIFGSVNLLLNNDWRLEWKKSGINEDYLTNNEGTFRIGAVNLFDSKGRKCDFNEFKESSQVFLINSFEKETRELIKDLQNQKYILNTGITTLDAMIDKQINIRNKNFSQMMEYFVDSPNSDEEKRSEYVLMYKKIYRSLEQFFIDYDKPFNSSFAFTKNGKVVGTDGLSMGEKQLFLLLLMVSNTNQKPCIFFMDEPDLSMHIDWKEILVKELHELNPNMQIILSTHAPSVITGWHDKVKEVNQLIKK